jgi:hypothetical protein
MAEDQQKSSFRGIRLTSGRRIAFGEGPKMTGESFIQAFLVAAVDDEQQRRSQMKPHFTGPGISEPRKFTLAQVECTSAGWANDEAPTPEEIRAAEKRWAQRSYRPEAVKDDWIPHQCGGCKFFAASGSDYGICWNEKSPLDGMIVFEHGGCLCHSAIGET